MECDKVQDQLAGGYMDGRLEAGEKAAIDAHAAACPRCREFRQALAQTRELLAAAPRTGVPSRVWENIEEALAPRPAWWEGWLVMPRPAFALAAVLVVMIAFGGRAWVAQDTARRSTVDMVVQLASMDNDAAGEEIMERGFGSVIEEMVL